VLKTIVISYGIDFFPNRIFFFLESKYNDKYIVQDFMRLLLKQNYNILFMIITNSIEVNETDYED